MKIEHRRIYTGYDADAFAARMPQRLRDDLCRGGAPMPPANVLREMIEGADEAWALSFDGEDVALYGVRADDTRQAFVMVIEAEGFEAGNKVPFMRAVARRMEEWGRRYGTLYGIIHKEFPEFIRFMEYIGFISETCAADERYALVVKTWE